MSSFSGTWDNNTRTGVGVMTYTCGDTVEGHFQDGHPHGVMVYKFFATGKTKLAKYEHGTRLNWINIKKASPRKKKFSFIE